MLALALRRRGERGVGRKRNLPEGRRVGVVMAMATGMSRGDGCRAEMDGVYCSMCTSSVRASKRYRGMGIAL